MLATRQNKTELIISGILLTIMFVAFCISASTRYVIYGVALLSTLVMVLLWAYRFRVSKSIIKLKHQLNHISGHRQNGQILVDRKLVADDNLTVLNSRIHALGQQLSGMQISNRTLEVQNIVKQRQVEQYKQILAMVSDPIIVTNAFEELIFANETAENLLNFHFDSNERAKIGDVISNGPLVRHIQQACSDGSYKTKRVTEQTFDSNDEVQIFKIQISTLPGANNKPAGVVTMLKDISHEKSVEQSKLEFISNVSHELKTPLASIKAYTEMLLDGEVEQMDQAELFYQTISDESQKLHGMIDRILDVSRVESGGLESVKEPVSLSAIIQQVSKDNAELANSKWIDFEANNPPAFYQVEANFNLICQAITDLIDNAIKFTPIRGNVNLTIDVDKHRKVAIFEISDNGIGISTENLPRIFNKFFRVHSNMKHVQGAGLGLPLVKFIVEKIHGGKLAVTSDLGKGSTFSFELPLVA